MFVAGPAVDLVDVNRHSSTIPGSCSSGKERRYTRRMTSPRLIVALDTPDVVALEEIIGQLAPLPVLFKLHWVAFPGIGFGGLKRVVERTGDRLMLDFKLHDIPNTVKHACRSILARVPARLLTVHALGGPAMLQAARRELDHYAMAADGENLPAAPKLLAITLLTHLAEEDLAPLGFTFRTRQEGVLHLARMAKDAGADGVVCTFAEAALLRREFGRDLLLVCPGLRPATSDADDHAHTATAEEARALEVDYVVCGRPIYNAPNPRKAAEGLLRELGEPGA